MEPVERRLERLRRGDGKASSDARGRELPDLYQVVVECRNEAEQRELFERMRGEGRRVRLLVL
jgi:hypothetical protein